MSEKLGQLLLKGWTMLGESCPMGCAVGDLVLLQTLFRNQHRSYFLVVQVPLMENRREQPPKSICVACEREFIKRINKEGEVEFILYLSEEERKQKELEAKKQEEEKAKGPRRRDRRQPATDENDELLTAPDVPESVQVEAAESVDATAPAQETTPTGQD